MSLELTIIISVISGLVGVLSIITFFGNNKQKSKDDGAKQGEMLNDIKYIKNTQQDIVLNQKELSKKFDEHTERLIRIEEKVKQHDDRLEKLEK